VVLVVLSTWRRREHVGLCLEFNSLLLGRVSSSVITVKYIFTVTLSHFACNVIGHVIAYFVCKVKKVKLSL
jgi:hypothetical protein